MNDALLQYLVARADLLRFVIALPGIFFLGRWGFCSIPPTLHDRYVRARMLILGSVFLLLATLCPTEAELYRLFCAEAP